MSDFDSNPFADPDLNNPFKVSVVPSIPRRRNAPLFVKTDKFLRALCSCSSALSRLDLGLGAAATVLEVAPGSPHLRV